MNKLVCIFAFLTACGGSKPAATTGTETGTQPVAACTPEECGPAPRFYQRCPDGSGVGAGPCERGPNGCAWQLEQCPTDPAPAPSGTTPAGTVTTETGTTGPAECTCVGDKPMMEALCPDGKSTVGATGRCIEGPNGCAWEMTACPTTP